MGSSKVKKKQPKVHLVAEDFGNCEVCGNWEDLRFGVCFKCAGRVTIDKKGICEDKKTGKRWKGRILH